MIVFDIDFLGGQKNSNDDRSEDIDLLGSRDAGYFIIIVLTPDNYYYYFLIRWCIQSTINEETFKVIVINSFN